ncbi:uncharacterized mitochondrial protein AtMg00810-like [Gossypium hirsutum]|uniref:Uncharacterized mitochondrial protein AtMg00810-like n=1 Tax=Gossypium hirsutum TaxID=3635 RepID=A0ABM3A9Q8_GOSHI|nr:uncharacterized mitochondrial protein AtMg00810-like [Gossypium hirsutum]
MGLSSEAQCGWKSKQAKGQASCEGLQSKVWSGLLGNICSSSQTRYNQIADCCCCLEPVDNPPNGCQVFIPQWILRRGDIHRATPRFYNAWSASEPTLYVKRNGAETQLIVSLYVDDLLVTGGDKFMLADFKTKMKEMFEMSDLGLITYFLRMEVNQVEGGILLKQKTFALKVLAKFSMENCKPMSTPMAIGMKLSSQEEHESVCETDYRSLIGCLLYLTATRPDILFAVSMLSRFMHCCNQQHYKAGKRVLRYIKGTLNHGICFKRVKELKLIGYTDSDWAGSKDDMKSTSGYAFTPGSAMICWSSRKQTMVAQSTAEAEYVAAANAVNQAVWLRKILSDLNLQQNEATVIHCDNKTKHFDIKLYVIREMEQAREIELIHCSSENQIADIFTKSLGVSRFLSLKRELGVCCIEVEEEC